MDIVTEIYHLQELSLYEHEKPYTMRYLPDGPIPASNVSREKKEVAVKDMRGMENTYSLSKNGFTVKSFQSQMRYEDYDSHDAITNIYLKEIQEVLSGLFPEDDIDFVSYLVSYPWT